MLTFWNVSAFHGGNLDDLASTFTTIGTVVVYHRVYFFFKLTAYKKLDAKDPQTYFKTLLTEIGYFFLRLWMIYLRKRLQRILKACTETMTKFSQNSILTQDIQQILLHTLACTILSRKWKSLPLAWTTYQERFYSPNWAKCMRIWKCHHYGKGKRMEILHIVFTHFCKFLEGIFCRRFPISTKKNGRLKSEKLMRQNQSIGNKTRQVSILLLWYSGSNGPSNGTCYLLI